MFMNNSHNRNKSSTRFSNSHRSINNINRRHMRTIRSNHSNNSHINNSHINTNISNIHSNSHPSRSLHICTMKFSIAHRLMVLRK